jgi:hypothetical protein
MNKFSIVTNKCLDEAPPEKPPFNVDIFDMHYGEAAKIIGCPLGTIKNRLARARLQMQYFLREDSHCMPGVGSTTGISWPPRSMGNGKLWRMGNERWIARLWLNTASRLRWSLNARPHLPLEYLPMK